MTLAPLTKDEYKDVKQGPTVDIVGIRGNEAYVKEQITAGRLGLAESVPELIIAWLRA